MNIVETLTKLEKYLGIEPVEVPENVASLVEIREFDVPALIDFVRKEYTVHKSLSGEDAELHKGYLGELLALAKFQFDADPSARQVKLPVAAKFGPSEMRMWRVFQNGAAPRMTSGGKFQFEKSEDEPATTGEPAATPEGDPAPAEDDLAAVVKGALIEDEFLGSLASAIIAVLNKQTGEEVPVVGSEDPPATAETIHKDKEGEGTADPKVAKAEGEGTAKAEVAKAEGEGTAKAEGEGTADPKVEDDKVTKARGRRSATDDYDEPKFTRGGSYIPATEDLSDPDFNIESLAGR